MEDPANSEGQSPNTGSVAPNDDLISSIRPGRYGWGRFTPQWLQTFNKPQWLVAVFCFAVVSSTLAGALMPAITDTLERRFHLNSVRSGLLNSSYDIASLLIVLFVCHYGERGHKGKWIGIGSIIFGLGSFVMVIPHYVAERYHPSSEAFWRNTTCPSDHPQDICFSGMTREDSASWSYYILLTGQAIRGFGGTCLGTILVSYIDENVSQRSSPFYISIISVLGLIAMAVGFMAGGQFLHLYGDFDRVPKEQWPKPWDPNWYGCWWMGYYVAAISSLLIAGPLLGFPKELPSKVEARRLDRQQAHNEDRMTGTGFAQNWSELPRNIMSLLKNPVFTCFTLRNTLEVCFGTGWGVFMPKYLQNMYGMDAGYAAMVSGILCLGPIMVGTLFGGWVIKRFNWKVRGVLFFGFVTTVIGSFACLGILFSCHTKLVAGANVDYGGNHIPKDTGKLMDVCNFNCSCDPSYYFPVCFREARITYFSPCYAGCTQTSLDASGTLLHTNCECLDQYFQAIPGNKSVVVGECQQQENAFCANQLKGFIVFWACTCLFYGMSGMPLVQSFLRAVPFKQRTLALGLGSVPMRLLGTIPGPILMGYLFDQSCILWKSQCGENTSCLQYDNETMNNLVLYIGLFIRITSGGLLLIAIILYRPPKPKAPPSNYGGAVNDSDKRTISEEDEFEGSYLDWVIRRVQRRRTSAEKARLQSGDM